MRPSRRPHKPTLQRALDTLRPWMLVIKALDETDAENFLPLVECSYNPLWHAISQSLNLINRQADDSFNPWIESTGDVA